MSIGLSTAVPRWYQIAVVLRNRIFNGAFAPGDRIPPEIDLAQEFGVSRMTVRQALDRLVQDGLIVRRQGIGTMVSEDFRPRPLALTGYLEDLLILFGQTEVVDAKIEEVKAPPEVGTTFGEPGKTCVRITRIRKRNQQMFSYSQSYLPAVLGRALSHDELRKHLLFEVLESRFGIVLTEAFETIGCRSADHAVAQHLNLDAGAPVLSITLQYFADRRANINPENINKGSPIAVTYVDVRPDVYAHRVRLVRLRQDKPVGSGDT